MDELLEEVKSLRIDNARLRRIVETNTSGKQTRGRKSTTTGGGRARATTRSSELPNKKRKSDKSRKSKINLTSHINLIEPLDEAGSERKEKTEKKQRPVPNINEFVKEEPEGRVVLWVSVNPIHATTGEYAFEHEPFFATHLNPLLEERQWERGKKRRTENTFHQTSRSCH